MKAITEKIDRLIPDSYNMLQPIKEQKFVLEKTDINKIMLHYGGYDNDYHEVRQADVGRTISYFTGNNGWKSWCFAHTLH